MFLLPDLDPDTRSHMVAEAMADADAGLLYRSPRLTTAGASSFLGALKAAFEGGTPESLTASLSHPGTFNQIETTRNGVVRRMASNAPALLAEGQFVRYYMRAVALRAFESGRDEVTVYRPRESSRHRPESDAQIGQRISASALLADLRENTLTPENVALPDINSGLCVRL